MTLPSNFTCILVTCNRIKRLPLQKRVEAISYCVLQCTRMEKCVKLSKEIGIQASVGLMLGKWIKVEKGGRATYTDKEDDAFLIVQNVPQVQ